MMMRPAKIPLRHNIPYRKLVFTTTFLVGHSLLSSSFATTKKPMSSRPANMTGSSNSDHYAHHHTTQAHSIIMAHAHTSPIDLTTGARRLCTTCNTPLASVTTVKGHIITACPTCRKRERRTRAFLQFALIPAIACAVFLLIFVGLVAYAVVVVMPCVMQRGPVMACWQRVVG